MSHSARSALLFSLVVLVVASALVAVPSSAPARDRDCGEFTTQAAAQAYFVALGGPTYDPDRLDADSDGIACESLPCPCGSATGDVPAPTPAAVPTVVPTATVTPTATPAPAGANADAAVCADRACRRRRHVAGQVGLGATTDRPVDRDRHSRNQTPKRPGRCGGTRATATMQRLAFQRGRGRLVTLVGDPSQDATDRYGRTLAFVDAEEKGDLGRLMVRAGLATVYVYEQPFARMGRYEEASAAAEAGSAGRVESMRRRLSPACIAETVRTMVGRARLRLNALAVLGVAVVDTALASRRSGRRRRRREHATPALFAARPGCATVVGRRRCGAMCQGGVPMRLIPGLGPFLGPSHSAPHWPSGTRLPRHRDTFWRSDSWP